MLAVRPRDRDILRDGDAHKVDDEEKSVHDAEELERDPIEVHQDDGQAEREEQARNQRHEGQSSAEFVRGFLPDRFQGPRITFGALETGFV